MSGSQVNAIQLLWRLLALEGGDLVIHLPLGNWNNSITQLSGSCFFFGMYWLIRNLYLKNSHPVKRHKQKSRANRSSYDCHSHWRIYSLQNRVSISMKSCSSRPLWNMSAILETRWSISSAVSEQFWTASTDDCRSEVRPLHLFPFLPIVKTSEKHWYNPACCINLERSQYLIYSVGCQPIWIAIFEWLKSTEAYRSSWCYCHEL